MKEDKQVFNKQTKIILTKFNLARIVIIKEALQQIQLHRLKSTETIHLTMENYTENLKVYQILEFHLNVAVFQDQGSRKIQFFKLFNQFKMKQIEITMFILMMSVIIKPVIKIMKKKTMKNKSKKMILNKKLKESAQTTMILYRMKNPKIKWKRILRTSKTYLILKVIKKLQTVKLQM